MRREHNKTTQIDFCSYSGVTARFTPTDKMWRRLVQIRRKFSTKCAVDDDVIFRAKRPMRRAQLSAANRIIVKLGSAVITREDECGLALGRLASIVEQVSWLHNNGKEVVLVTSGAVAFGKQRMKHEKLLSQSMRSALLPNSAGRDLEPRACAAAGQAGLMALYESMFAQYGISCAQVLLTGYDFLAPKGPQNFLQTLDCLLGMKVVPILNANDVHSPPPQKNSDLQDVVSIPDNDHLSSLVATATQADLLILLSDVDGLYTGHPSDSKSRLIKTYYPEHPMELSFWGKSRVGLGGMENKLKSAVKAVEGGTPVVIANGTKGEGTILNIVSGKPVGTLVTSNGHSEVIVSAEQLADQARSGSRALQTLSSDQRASILHHLATLLGEREKEIMAANQQDLEAARELSSPLRARLSLSPQRLASLADGLRQLADGVVSCDIVGEEVEAVTVGEGLELVRRKVPLGVVLVVFESRPDCLPQLAGLAIATGNGLLLKGGSEAVHSNRYLHGLVQEALQTLVPTGAVALVDSREEIGDLLTLEGKIDLAIPRGGQELVKAAMEMASGRVPVLGHTEGVCHVFIDKHVDLEKALRIIVDSKCSYPAACNAMESLLVHSDLLETPVFTTLTSLLKENQVTVYPGPTLATLLPISSPVATLSHEYGSLEVTVEVVRSVEEAVEHINTYGSGHTDCIVTEDSKAAHYFLTGTDSACVFHNASTRFSDGYRFGLGAEVGISTGRVHARGPVGKEGLMTTQWVLRGEGHTVADFEGPERTQNYTHVSLQSSPSSREPLESTVMN